MATSAGILVYRHSYPEIEFLLLKPGGPFYKNHENFIWTIPKGEIQENESEVQAARREFNEETGFFISCPLQNLGKFRLRKGKTIVVFIANSDFNLSLLQSKKFEMEYPKQSGQLYQFSEITEGKWMTFEQAQTKVFPNQLPILVKAIGELRSIKKQVL